MLTELGAFGTRARPFNLPLQQPVLVIGVGQVGFQAITRLQGMLRYALPPREMQAGVRLLGIAERHSIQQEQSLARDSRLLLTIDPIQWGDVPGRFAAHGVARWWPRTPNNPDLQKNPTASRPFGRLLLWSNAQIVGEKLYEMSKWLAQSAQRAGQPQRVLILASLAEAEGSGMLVDVIGRVRILTGAEAEIIGIFTASQESEDENVQLTSMSYVYTALKELDAMSLQPASYPHDFPFVGVAGNPATLLPARPLNHICLTGDARIPTAQPEAALTEWATTLILNHAQPGEALPLLPPHPHTHQNRYSGYTMFGVAKIALPVKTVLDIYAVDVANAALSALNRAHAEPIDSWVQKIITRAHTDLLSKGLAEHHRLTDKIRELNRRLHSNQLYQQISKAGRSKKDLREFAVQEWRKLPRENEPEERDPDGVAIPRDVLRRRIDSALQEGLSTLIADTEKLVVNLAYEEGRGLAWTHRLFEELARQLDVVLQKVRERVPPAWTEVEERRDSWLAAALGKDKDIAHFDRISESLVLALVHWIGWQARAVYWEEFRDVVGDIRERLDLARQQLPLEGEKLKAVRQGGASTLDAAMQGGLNFNPSAPVVSLCTPSWIKNGLQALPPLEDMIGDELVRRLFERWDGQGHEPLLQLGRFPRDLLDCARLLIQPQARFAGIHDFAIENQEQSGVLTAFQAVRSASDPAWVKALLPVTGKLDQDAQPPQAFEVVREFPRAFSAVPRTESGRITFLNVPSPDPDEVTVIRLMHGWAVEHIRTLKEEYRRAYYRITADNVPLHIDRRWETTMADLVHTSIRAEMSALWEKVYQASLHGQTSGLDEFVALLAKALEADTQRIQPLPTRAPDIQAFVLPLKPFRLKIPPPNCTFIFLLAQRATHEIADDLLQSLLGFSLEEDFCFVVNLAGRGDMSQILEPLREQSLMPLELTESDVKHIVSAPRATSALRDIVIGRINLAAISPFYTRAPVPDHMFFGREKEIVDVRSKLTTHSVVLIGGRRIGKTSMLQKIKRALDTADSMIVPYYLDCSNVLQHSHFFRRIQRDWRVEVSPDADPIEFDEVVDQLTNRHTGHKPVFLLDEVDRLLKTDQGAGYDEPLFRTFRSLSNEKRCQFVFSGEKLLLGSLRNAHSVLFNFPKDVRLEPLRQDVVRRLVTEPFEMLNIWLENADDIIQQIYQISAGHPNIVQTICHALVTVMDRDKRNNLLRREHLGQALDMHDIQVDIVETIWGQMHPFAKLVTLLWPEGTRQMSLEDILRLIHRAGLPGVMTQEVKTRVIPDLELYNFVRQVGQEYQLIPVYFPTILDFMTDKRMEIQAILETAHELQDSRPARPG